MRYSVTKLLIALCAFGIISVKAQSRAATYEPQRDRVLVPKQPYERYFTRDKFGREITFYLSEARAKQDALPLVVYVQGSGCTSLFARRNDRVAPTSGHITVQQVTEGKARVLIVEKPGVKFLDDPQAGCTSGSEFSREHTLDRWAEAVEAAIRAARKLPQVRKDKTLVIGHSEGGLVASRVARDLPAVVTHVASLAGGGVTQLFDLLTLARKGKFFRQISEDPEARVKYVLEQWQAIQAEPLSTEKFFFGFAYRRWSSLLASSPLEELSRVRAKIYLAQGVDDDAVDVASGDALFAQLQAHGKQLVYDRVEGADHSFNIKGKQEINGWQEEFVRIVAWYLT